MTSFPIVEYPTSPNKMEVEGWTSTAPEKFFTSSLSLLPRQQIKCPAELPEPFNMETKLTSDSFLQANWMPAEKHYMANVALVVKQIVSNQRNCDGKKRMITNVMARASAVSEVQISAWEPLNATLERLEVGRAYLFSNLGLLELGDFAVGNLPYQLRFRFGSDVKLLVNDLPSGAAAAAAILPSNQQLALPAPANSLLPSGTVSNSGVQQGQGSASIATTTTLALSTNATNYVLPPPPIPPPMTIPTASVEIEILEPSSSSSSGASAKKRRSKVDSVNKKTIKANNKTPIKRSSNLIESGDDSRDSLILTPRKRHRLTADLNNDENALDSDDMGSDEDPSVRQRPQRAASRRAGERIRSQLEQCDRWRTEHAREVLQNQIAAIEAATRASESQYPEQPPALTDDATVYEMASFYEPNSGGVEENCFCLELLELDDMIMRMPCGHKFHLSCGRKWVMEAHANCPLCKKPLTAEYH